MSDNCITLIPEDPRYVPDISQRTRALNRFLDMAPDAHNIEIILHEKVGYFCSGSNHERVLCPACRAELTTVWWQERMTDDYQNDGFLMNKYATPCCNKLYTLNEMVYEWPEGFGRFGLEATNPNIGRFDESYKAQFEEILGTKLRVIYGHW